MSRDTVPSAPPLTMRHLRQWLADMGHDDVDAATIEALRTALDVVEAERAFRAHPGGKGAKRINEKLEAFNELVSA